MAPRSGPTLALLLLAAALPLVPASPNAAAAFWDGLAAATGVSPLPPHTPNFTVTLQHVPYLGAAGPYSLATHVVRDQAAGGVVVAVWVEDDSLGQEHNITGLTPGLNLLAPTPAMAPLQLPPLKRYGWAFLYGARVVTISWLDCCSLSGDATGFSFVAAPDGASATLSQWQSWVPTGRFPGRAGRSEHNFTLVWDATYGYSVNAVTALRINAPAVQGLAAIEFLNFLAPTLLQPWPAGARVGTWGGVLPSGAPLPPALGPWPLPLSTHTAFSTDADGAGPWGGFANNVLAGGEMDRYFMRSPTGATLYAVPGGFSPGVAWAATPAQGAGGMAQETCPAWGDQHHFVLLPPTPGGDGDYVLAPHFALRWAPPPIAAHVLARLVDAHSGPPPPQYPYPPARWSASNFLRVGVVESFEAQGVPLTQPLRALAYSSGRSGATGYDYDVRGGLGRAGGAAWRVAALEAEPAASPYAFQSPVPLLPLNCSTHYALSAWVRLVATAPSATAMLWVGLYEEALTAGPGPSYGRLAYFNSSVLVGGGGGAAAVKVRGEATAWVSAAVRGGAPVLRGGGGGSAGSEAGWTQLVVRFTAPAWASFADLRPIVVSPAGGADYAVVDDWLFTQE